MRRAVLIVASGFAFIIMPVIATAHNVGHLTLPDGTCHQVGSGREAPLVGPDRTQLDLVPATPNPPRDEYGVSFVGYGGQTSISPGPCPAQALASAPVNDSALAVNETMSTSGWWH